MVKVSAILLGAGESKRMGLNKLSLPWKKKTVLQHCLGTLTRSEVDEVIVVLGERSKRIEDQCKGPKVRVIMNRHSSWGISSSIQRGVKSVSPNSEGILIALGDMPFLRGKTVNSLIRAFVRGEGGIVVPSFEKRRGHPVIFHRRYMRELLKLKGDAGAKSIVERHGEDVRVIPVRSAGVLKDIDTPGDYPYPLSRRANLCRSLE